MNQDHSKNSSRSSAAQAAKFRTNPYQYKSGSVAKRCWRTRGCQMSFSITLGERPVSAAANPSSSPCSVAGMSK